MPFYFWGRSDYEITRLRVYRDHWFGSQLNITKLRDYELTDAFLYIFIAKCDMKKKNMDLISFPDGWKTETAKLTILGRFEILDRVIVILGVAGHRGVPPYRGTPLCGDHYPPMWRSRLKFRKNRIFWKTTQTTEKKKNLSFLNIYICWGSKNRVLGLFWPLFGLKALKFCKFWAILAEKWPK